MKPSGPSGALGPLSDMPGRCADFSTHEIQVHEYLEAENRLRALGTRLIVSSSGAGSGGVATAEIDHFSAYVAVKVARRAASRPAPVDATPEPSPSPVGISPSLAPSPTGKWILRRELCVAGVCGCRGGERALTRLRNAADAGDVYHVIVIVVSVFGAVAGIVIIRCTLNLDP